MPFFLNPCCKTDRFRWTADKFWFGGIVSSLVGCIKADQALISQIAACSLYCCSTVLSKALLCYCSGAHFVAAQLFCKRLYSTSLVLLTAITSTCSANLNLATYPVLLSSTFLTLLTQSYSTVVCYPFTRFCSLPLHLLGSTLLLYAHFFYSHLNSFWLCYFTLVWCYYASVVAIAQNKETWRSSVLRWLRNFCMINNLSLVLLTFTNSI